MTDDGRTNPAKSPDHFEKPTTDPSTDREAPPTPDEVEEQEDDAW